MGDWGGGSLEFLKIATNRTLRSENRTIEMKNPVVRLKLN